MSVTEYNVENKGVLSLSVEDILDEVSGLTVESMDEGVDGQGRPNLQSPEDQEDRSLSGPGQKVGRWAVQRFWCRTHVTSRVLCPWQTKSVSCGFCLCVDNLPCHVGVFDPTELSLSFIFSGNVVDS